MTKSNWYKVKIQRDPSTFTTNSSSSSWTIRDFDNFNFGDGNFTIDFCYNPYENLYQNDFMVNRFTRKR